MRRRIIVIHNCDYKSAEIQDVLWRADADARWITSKYAEEVGFWKGRTPPTGHKALAVVVFLVDDVIVDQFVSPRRQELEVFVRSWVNPDYGKDDERSTAAPSAEHLERMRQIEASPVRSNHVPHLSATEMATDHDGIATVVHPSTRIEVPPPPRPDRREMSVHTWEEDARQEAPVRINSDARKITG
ncbi:MAG: hypothetical protein WCT29_00610 [Candidatus Paceibacterota bacterium]|jgi:hypothetical protein